MEFEFFITSFVALFIIIDPIGITPVFIALTQGMGRKVRRRIALRSIVVSAFVISLFIIFGEPVLGFIGISMPAFRIAGGILLFLTALDMLFQRRSKRRENQTENELINDPSVFPLAIPLITGPWGYRYCYSNCRIKTGFGRDYINWDYIHISVVYCFCIFLCSRWNRKTSR